MKKENAIRYYRKFSGADAYILGFVYKHDLYYITVDEIMPRFMRVEKSSSKKGGHEKLQLRLNNKYMEQLIRKGAEKIGTEDDLLEIPKNKTLLKQINPPILPKFNIYILPTLDRKTETNINN